MLIALDRTLAGLLRLPGCEDRQGQLGGSVHRRSRHRTDGDYASKMRIPAFNFEPRRNQDTAQYMLKQQYGKEAKYVVYVDYPTVHLDSEAFEAVNVNRMTPKKQ